MTEFDYVIVGAGSASCTLAISPGHRPFAEDSRSVARGQRLDDQMRVRGVDGLRVVDGSAMPQVVRGPPNAPIMMAEKISDSVLKTDESARKPVNAVAPRSDVSAIS
jgi:choline dehydrogenase-like flavoprotein